MARTPAMRRRSTRFWTIFWGWSRSPGSTGSATPEPRPRHRSTGGQYATGTRGQAARSPTTPTNTLIPPAGRCRSAPTALFWMRPGGHRAGTGTLRALLGDRQAYAWGRGYVRRQHLEGRAIGPRRPTRAHSRATPAFDRVPERWEF